MAQASEIKYPMNPDAYLDQFQDQLGDGRSDAQLALRRLAEHRRNKHLKQYCPTEYNTYTKCVHTKGAAECESFKPAFDSCLQSFTHETAVVKKNCKSQFDLYRGCRLNPALGNCDHLFEVVWDCYKSASH